MNYIRLRIILVKILLIAQYIVYFLLTSGFEFGIFHFAQEQKQALLLEQEPETVPSSAFQNARKKSKILTKYKVASEKDAGRRAE